MENALKKMSRFCNRNPLLAAWLGLLAALLITLCAAPMLVRHVEHVARSAT